MCNYAAKKKTFNKSKMCFCKSFYTFDVSSIILVEAQTCTHTEKKVQVNKRPNWNDNIFSFAQRDYISSSLSLLYFSPGLGCLHWKKRHKLWNIEAIHPIKIWILSSIKSILISSSHGAHLLPGQAVIAFYRSQLRRSWASAMSEEGRLQPSPEDANQHMWFNIT